MQIKINKELKMTLIDPLSDFGFKKIFANPNHKEVTIFLLNTFLQLENKITEIEFQNLEDSAESLEVRGVIYDILCKDSQNREFIVELQRAKQEFFADRSIFYVCRHLNSQIKKSRLPENRKKRFQLLPIYFLGILNFETIDGDKFTRRASIKDEDCYKLTNSINLTYIELPKFKIDKPQNDMEKLLFFLKNSEKLQERIFPESIFTTILDIANYYNLSDSEQLVYDTILNKQLANIDAIETAKKTEKREIARNMLNDRLPLDLISRYTGLSISEINNL